MVYDAFKQPRQRRIHSALKEGIEFGNACPHIASFDEVKSGSAVRLDLRCIVTRDRALDAESKIPLVRVHLEGDPEDA